MANTFTPRLGLREMADGEQSGYVTFNDVMRMLDGQLNIQVETTALGAPPGGELDGQLWLVADPASGAWLGQEGKIAQWYNGQWYFYNAEGVLLWDKASGEFTSGAQPNVGATMALSGAEVTGVTIPTTPGPINVADVSLVAQDAPNPTTVDMTNSRFTINDHTDPKVCLVSANCSMQAPSSSESYFMGLYKNGTLEAHARDGANTTNQYGGLKFVVINAVVEVQTGDVLEVRFSAGASRTVSVQSFMFTILDS